MNIYWSTLHIPEPPTQKDLGQQEKDVAAAPRTTPKFIRPAPKSKGKPRRCCLQGWSGSRRADGKGDREAAPSAIKENGIAERQGQAPSMQSVAHQACWKVNGQAEKALLAEGFPASVVTNVACSRLSLNMGRHRYCLRCCRPCRKTELTATSGNAGLQCATPACTSLARHESDIFLRATLSLFTL